MNVKHMYKNVKKHLGKIVLIPFMAGIISGCGNPIDRQIYSGEINGKKVVIYDVKESTLLGPRKIRGTKIVVSDKSGKMEKILYDDKSGQLGDEYQDYVEIYQKDGEKIKYAPNYYVNEKGQTIKFNSDIGKELKSIIKNKFKDYDKEYQELKTEISKSIEETL